LQQGCGSRRRFYAGRPFAYEAARLCAATTGPVVADALCHMICCRAAFGAEFVQAQFMAWPFDSKLGLANWRAQVQMLGFAALHHWMWMPDRQ